MPHNSLKKLLGMFPYFFTKDESSNFVKSQKVTNNRFKDLYNSLYDTYLSFALEKKCLIYKEQEEPYNYIMHFICNIPLLENVKIYSESDLIYEARFELSSDGSVSYLREEDIHSYNVVEEVIDDETVNEIHHDMHTQYHDISEDIKTIEYSYNDSSETIIPETEYHIEVTTFDEYTTSKGFPENDTPLNNIFDHDISLDEIGALNNIPRKKYVPTQNYSKTEPAYNNRASEDDYHYMQRILKYLLLIHSEPLAVAEIFKLYGLEAKLINRDRFLCKMFDIFKHPYHYEPDSDGDQLFVDDWEPEAWEHKDKLCPGNIFLGEYFYVFTDTIQPVKKQSVTFCFKFLNGIFEPLTGDFTIDIYLNGVIYIPNYTGECLLIPPEVLSEINDNLFCFVGKQGDRVIGEWCETIHVRGCSDADFFIKANGNDNNNGKTSNTPFATLNKGLTSVNGIYNLVSVWGSLNYNGQGFAHETSYVIGCDNGVLNNNIQPVFFKIAKGETLRVIDLTLNLLDGSINDEMSNTYVDYDVFINEKCENTADSTKETALMYNVNYGVLIDDLPNDKFIKDLSFNTQTGVLSWTEYTLDEFKKLSDLKDVVYDMELIPDDDVYYDEYVPITSEEKLLNRPFVYLDDRKLLKDAIQTMTYNNSNGILCLDLCGDEIIWEPKSHLI